jgi:hypothetical protein
MKFLKYFISFNKIVNIFLKTSTKTIYFLVKKYI